MNARTEERKKFLEMAKKESGLRNLNWIDTINPKLVSANANDDDENFSGFLTWFSQLQNALRKETKSITKDFGAGYNGSIYYSIDFHLISGLVVYFKCTKDEFNHFSWLIIIK